MKKEQIRKTGTNDALCGAFWKLYTQKPITEITIKELTREADVHRSSFYSHYDDIYDLLTHCEEDLLEQMEACMDVNRFSDDEPSLMNTVIAFYQDHIEQVSALVGPHGDPGFMPRLREQAIPQIMTHMTIPTDNKECYYTLDLIVNSILTFLTTWYIKEHTLPPTEMIRNMRHVIMDGCKLPLKKYATDQKTVSRYVG